MTRESGATVVVPVKPWRLSKSRMSLVEEDRSALSRAFALDVIEVIVGSIAVGRLVVVTAEAELAGLANRHGAVVLGDRPMLTADGLNVALDLGRRWAKSHRPNAPILVVPADMPSLTTTVLDQTVAKLRRHASSFVPDAAGRGTTISWCSKPSEFKIRYGTDSAIQNSGRGSYALLGADQRARQDVDTRTDLAEARLLGVGVHTTMAIDQILLPSERR